MAGVTDEMAFGFNFELFTHVTRFCGRKVVLLGLYNGQGLQEEPEEEMVTYSRTTEVSCCQLPLLFADVSAQHLCLYASVLGC